MNRHDNKKLQLVVAKDYGVVYIGIIIKAIIDLLSTQFGGLSASAIGNEILDRKIGEVISQYFTSQALKKCPNCQSENRGNAKYCDSCGHKFLWWLIKKYILDFCKSSSISYTHWPITIWLSFYYTEFYDEFRQGWAVLRLKTIVQG